jgi:hypothetical protein
MSALSLILPYWQRQAATDEAMRALALHYSDMEGLEVVIVNDGGEPYELSRSLPLYVVTHNLAPKDHPLNPCVPYNYGVANTRSEYIALSNPEILHIDPILEQMLEECKRDPMNYVMAACWCPEQKRWHAHSSQKRSRRWPANHPHDNDVGAYIPDGASYHFMTMMHRSLWDKTGGFDEDYRQGAGYDDPDFVRRLHNAGAKFIMRDDLVVQHPRTGARADWTGEMHARNRAIFMDKWQPL